MRINSVASSTSSTTTTTATTTATFPSSIKSPDPYREYLDSELASEGERSVHGIITQIARYCGLKFGALILSQPFEAAQLLRQLQYGDGSRKSDEFLAGGSLNSQPSSSSSGANSSFTTSPPLDSHHYSGGDRYSTFTTDPGRLERQKKLEQERLGRSQSHRLSEFVTSTQSTQSGPTATNPAMIIQGNDLDFPLTTSRSPAQLIRDPSGYLQSQPMVSPSFTRPTSQWPLNLDKHRSLLHTIGDIANRQGFFSLWQGILSSWTLDVLMDLGRATMEEALDSSQLVREMSNLIIPSTILSSPSTSSISISTNELTEDLLTPTLIAGFAQGIVGTILSPLEVARIRLMAQSVWPYERKYGNIISVLQSIKREEGNGGWWSCFKNPFLTFTCYFMKPINRILPVNIITSLWTPPEDAHWTLTLLWLGLQNVALCVPLLWTLPLETIRRRLMVQFVPQHPNETTKPFITRVHLNTTTPPYSGLFNCLWRMLKEEGFGSLYQGWSLQVVSTMASFASTFLVELGEEDLADDDLEGF